MIHRRKTGPTNKAMPPLTRETLALRLRQNWLAKHPVDQPIQTGQLDDSLTSLNWLQNLNIMKITTPTPPSSPVHSDKQNKLPHSQFSSNTQVNPNAVLDMTHLTGKIIKTEPGLVSPPCRTISNIEIVPPHGVTSLDKIDYKASPHIKPPYSYATLICMAMRESKKNKITLAGIYNWITENFMYYRVADPSWQNSIRHNLSLNKCFQKVPRRKDEPGKGGFWRINPDYEDMFVNGIFKKRRCSPMAPRDPVIAPPPLKRIKREPEEDSNSSMTSLSGLATATAVQSILTPMNSIEDYSEPSVVEVKPETQELTASGLFRQMAGADLSDTIEFSWNAILNQDIEVGGVKVKTEDILDEADPVANSITALSPPPSENSSDISLDDLLNTQFATDLDDPLDLETGDPLDLTVTGVGVKAPQWWEESLNGKQAFMSPGNQSRMSTPVAPDSELDLAHPWAEDKLESENAVASLDKDFTNFFDMLESFPITDS